MIPASLVLSALFSLLVAAVALPWLLRWGGRLRMGLVLALLCGASFQLSMAWQKSPATQVFYATGEHLIENRPVQRPRDGYVGSQSCKSCHPDQHSSWHASYHRTMAQLASPDAVLGDFDDVELVEKGGRKVRFFRKGDEYWMEAEEPPKRGGRKIERQVVMTTGSHNHQAYWFQPKKGRSLGTVPYIWSVRMQRWMPYNSGFLMPGKADGPALNTGAWNKHCMKCHAVKGALRYEPPERMRTEVVELGISCESCHGPAEEHVQKFSDPLARYAQHLASDDGSDTGMSDPSKMDHRRSSEVCGQCHSVNLFYEPEDADVWNAEGYPFKPGEDLSDTKYVVDYLQGEEYTSVRRHLAREKGRDPHWWDQNFWRDGQVLVTGREFSGLRETPCFIDGEMSCLSCHEMHPDEDDSRPLEEWRDDQLAPGMRTNTACTQCHAEYEDPAVLGAHSHHAPDGPGSTCYNCHMPHTTYGLLKAIRSHHLTSPDVKVELESTRPNACNLCHLDKPIAWTAQRLQDWYGVEPPSNLDDDQKTLAAGVLYALKGHALVRALVSWHFGWGPSQKASGTDWSSPFLLNLMDDNYDAVRRISERSLRSLPGQVDFDYDHLGKPMERQKAIASLLQSWSGRGAGEPNPALLQLRDGSIDTESFRRLLAQRDPRKIIINE